jgi:hypothetical protein
MVITPVVLDDFASDELVPGGMEQGKGKSYPFPHRAELRESSGPLEENTY